MIPVVVRSSEEMLRIVPGELREASYALGVRKWRTILKVVIPTAISGIASGVTCDCPGDRRDGPHPGDSRFRQQEQSGCFRRLDVLASHLHLHPDPEPDIAIQSRSQRAARGAAALLLIIMVMLLNLVAPSIARLFRPQDPGAKPPAPKKDRRNKHGKTNRRQGSQRLLR